MDWREQTMARIRELMKQADPEITEDKKWKTPSNPEGVWVWYCDGMICTGETYKKHLRLTFAKGNLLHEHPLINTYRAMVIEQTDTFTDEDFIALVRAAVKLNQQGKK